MSEPVMVVGLTGGIASGKSSVANMFADYEIDIIDSDIGSREVVKRGTFGLQGIIARYGENILLRSSTTDDVLDRAALRNIIFKDKRERQWLNNHLHPLIRDWVDHKTQAAKSIYVINVVPLLIDNNLQSTVDKIITVDVPEELQIKRLMSRDQMSEQYALKIIESQASRGDRLAAADYVIDNSETLEQTQKEVDSIHESLMEICELKTL
jgi:dephospho-CoA kinase